MSELNKKDYDASEVGRLIAGGKRVVLLGEYGSGKSRCLREIFFTLSTSAVYDVCYPIAVDLRESWGLKRGTEILRRHFEDLALERLEDSAIGAMAAGSVALLIDGFDEIGSQSWSNDSQQLKQIRAQSLQGVKDLLQRSKGGALITGRDHYFSNSDEMFACLGLDPSTTLVLKCRDEFTNGELAEFFKERNLTVTLPPWLPKRPMICQTIGNLEPEQLEEMFGVGGGETDFWHHLIEVICRRDAAIHPTFDASTIKKVLVNLAGVTRRKSANVGPISLLESQKAFEMVVGQMLIEEASAMLQRLPCLGRVSSESSERQFVDEYILDGLRAIGVSSLLSGDDLSTREVMATVWINPLDELGLKILARHSEGNERELFLLATRSLSDQNRVLGSDIVASLLLDETSTTDFRGIAIDQGKFMLCDLSKKHVKNLSIANSYFSKLVLPHSAPVAVNVLNCVAERVYGASSSTGLPPWITSLEAEIFDSIENVAKIRKLDLSPQQQVLVTIIKKTFFQKGAGRKEEALLRGLGQLVSPPVLQKILSLLIREGCLEKFRGEEGMVYHPIRSQAGRMKKMLYELRSSDDLVWKGVEDL